MTTDELVAYWTALRDERQQEIQSLRARLGKLEREQAIIEGAWVIVSEASAVPRAPTPRRAVDGRFAPTGPLTKTAHMLNALKAAGPMTSQQVVEALQENGVTTSQSSVSAILNDHVHKGNGIIRVGKGLFAYVEPTGNRTPKGATDAQ